MFIIHRLGICAVLTFLAGIATPLYADTALPALGEPAWSFTRGTVGEFVRKDHQTVAEIRVPAGTKPQYQQAQTIITDSNLSGAAFQLSVEVNTRELSPGFGAYAVIEFLNRDHKRISICNSTICRVNTSNEWEELIAFGMAPNETASLRVGLILHANGVASFARPQLTRFSASSNWPDLGDAQRVLTPSRKPVTRNLVGVGFHCFQQVFDMSPEDFDLIYRYWDDINPSIARLTHYMDYGRPELDRMARHMIRMQKTGTVFYITSWKTPVASTEAEYQAYARHVADDLSYLIHEKGCTGIRWYCMANELSLTAWGSLLNDLPRFKQYHQALYQEFKKRGLKVGLLATDSSPASSWNTITWASKNMAKITAAYGGHHYINEFEPDSLVFAPWFEQYVRTYVQPAKEQHKPFILGEFGSKIDGSIKNGIKQDRCVYYETPKEPWVGLQLAEATIASLRAGVDAMGYWTFLDIPDQKTWLNKWGLIRNSGTDRSIRSPYYAYGLLTRAFRSGLRIFPLETQDPFIRAVAGQSPSGAWSVAIVNRNGHATRIKLALPAGITWQVNRYQPDHIVPGAGGFLAIPAVQNSNEITLAPNELAVLVQSFDNPK